MTYIYQTLIDLRSKDADQLRIGKSLERSLAYLRSFLPDEPGFVSARAMVSKTQGEKTSLVLESCWEDWGALENHLLKSPFAEHKILPKFDLDLARLDFTTSIFEELG
jgi:hypothetical protein